MSYHQAWRHTSIGLFDVSASLTLGRPEPRPTGSSGSGTSRARRGPESPTPPETWRRSDRSRCRRHHPRRTWRTKFWREVRGRPGRGTPTWNPRIRSSRICSRRRRKTASGGRVWLRPWHQNHAGCWVKSWPPVDPAHSPPPTAGVLQVRRARWLVQIPSGAGSEGLMEPMSTSSPPSPSAAAAAGVYDVSLSFVFVFEVCGQSFIRHSFGFNTFWLHPKALINLKKKRKNSTLLIAIAILIFDPFK